MTEKRRAIRRNTGARCQQRVQIVAAHDLTLVASPVIIDPVAMFVFLHQAEPTPIDVELRYKLLPLGVHI